jgi:hypothetical protein
MVVRRADLLDVGGFDERFRILEDSDMLLRLAARGPFALVRRRTIVHSVTHGSLIEGAARRGDYLDALDLMTRNTARAVDGLSRPDVSALRARALGGLHLVHALRALVGRDDAAVREELAQACRGLPELSTNPGLVAMYIRRVVPGDTGGDVSARHFATAARAWPDPSSDTAFALRCGALGRALRTGRARLAGRLLREWPVRHVPRFLLLRLPRLLARWTIPPALELLDVIRSAHLPRR